MRAIIDEAMTDVSSSEETRMSRTPTTARRLFDRFEPIHAVTYFAPESRAAFDGLGLRGFWMGYFAARRHRWAGSPRGRHRHVLQLRPLPRRAGAARRLGVDHPPMHCAPARPSAVAALRRTA